MIDILERLPLISKIFELATQRISQDSAVWLRVSISFLLAIASSILGCKFGYANAHKDVSTLMIVGFLLPMVNFVISHFFINSPTFKEKILMVLANSFALSISAVFVCLYLT